jgi:endonuclease-3
VPPSGRRRTAPRGGGRARASAARTRERLAAITDLLEERFGRPKSDPDPDLVGSLVQTILSQNTSDVNSARAYDQLLERFPRWELAEATNVRSIEAAIRSGGLARIKAGRIKDVLREIREETGALDLGFLRETPTDEVIDYLRGFKGVGAKTAACVALFDLGREVVPVDTHVHRIVGRLGVVGAPRTRDETYEALQPVAPPGRALSLHVNLIRLGRAVCHPRLPRCGECPLVRRCAYARAGGARR